MISEITYNESAKVPVLHSAKTWITEAVAGDNDWYWRSKNVSFSEQGRCTPADVKKSHELYSYS